MSSCRSAATPLSLPFPSRRWVDCGSDCTLRVLRLCVRLSAPDYAACVLRSRSTGAAGIRNGLFSAGLTFSARFGFRNRLRSAALVMPEIAQRPMRVDCGSNHRGAEPERSKLIALGFSLRYFGRYMSVAREQIDAPEPSSKLFLRCAQMARPFGPADLNRSPI